MTGPLKILDMVSSQNERRTGDLIVFSLSGSVGASIYRQFSETSRAKRERERERERER